MYVATKLELTVVVAIADGLAKLGAAIEVKVAEPRAGNEEAAASELAPKAESKNEALLPEASGSSGAPEMSLRMRRRETSKDGGMSFLWILDVDVESNLRVWFLMLQNLLSQRENTD